VCAEGDPNIKNPSGITAIWSGTLSNNIALAAKETETLKDGLSKLSASISEKKTGEIITAEYFKSIREAMNAATISGSACDECNAEC
jgi:hypothetical protein